MWRSVAARVACLSLLGSDLPQGVQQWVSKATAFLDAEDRFAPSDGIIFDDRDQVYAAFREAYARAEPMLRQRLAAAQDTFRGDDYYCEEVYMLEADESSPTYTGAAYAADSAAHCDIIRDIFNPFRPAPSLPDAVLAWNDGTVRRIAEGIYGERKMPEGTLYADRISILGDALLDAGCEDEALIQHCREPGPHVRGCWAVDLCLGKS